MSGAYRDDMPFSIHDVVGYLGLTVKRAKSTELQVNCPFCLGKNGQPDTNGHMSVSLTHDRFKCFRCDRSGGKLDLYAMARNVDRKQAYREMMCWIEGKSPGGTVVRRMSPVPLPSFESEIRAPLEDRNNTYLNLLEQLTLTSAHRNSLHKRGLPDEEIERLGYRSVPAVGHRRIASTLLKLGCELDGVPGFYIGDDGKWTLNVWLTGIMIPVRSPDGLICGFQIRKDRVRKGEHKFYTLTSRDKPHGTPYKAKPHFTPAAGPTDTATAWLTEGVMKADIAAYLGSDFFVGLPGATQYETLGQALCVLKAMSVRNLVFAWDMDKHDNTNVMEGLEKCGAIARREGFHVKFYNWDPRLKGIDDYRLWEKQSRKGELPCEQKASGSMWRCEAAVCADVGVDRERQAAE